MLEKVRYYYKKYGLIRVVKKIFRKIFHIKDDYERENRRRYIKYMEKNDLTQEEIKRQKEFWFDFKPKISIVVPMYNTDERFLNELIDSLINQTYHNWELCLADGSEKQNEEFKRCYQRDGRIKYEFLNSNKGISGNTNEAIKMTTGEYIGFLDHDDLLSQDSLFEVVDVINKNMNVDFIYTDEDKIDEQGNRFDPYFKPDFSPETLECNNYITHLVIVKKELLDKVGTLNSKFDGAQDFDLVLRITEKTKNILHIPKVLYHWRVHETSTANVADAKPYAYEAGKKVIEEHLKRTGKKGYVEYGNEVPGIYRINYEVKGTPKVSIIIPSRENKELLTTCINTILKLTTYENYEIVIIENNSEKQETLKMYKELKENKKIKVLTYPEKEFNYSAIINYGVKNCDGEYVLQLNNDTKLISKDWLETFIGYAQNKEIGAIGARLYYEDMSIQHAGIAYGIGGTAGNLLVNLTYGKHGYFGREAATRNVSAVTGACLFARREIYEEVGYMDDGLPVAFNDVDFCLKIIEKGYRILYNPHVEMIHYESKTRGYEMTEEKEKRFKEESDKFKEKWKDLLNKPDPYYNINFSKEHCDFRIDDIIDKTLK